MPTDILEKSSGLREFVLNVAYPCCCHCFLYLCSVALLLNIALDRADTKPSKSGFYVNLL